MKRWFGITIVALGLVSAVATCLAQSPPAGKPNFSGAWTLNRDLSDKASRGGFDPSAADPRGDPRGGPGRTDRGEPGGAMGRGRPGIMGPAGGPGDRYRTSPSAPTNRLTIQTLTSEARVPSPSLTISHNDPTLAVTDAHGRTRLFQTNGQKDQHQVGADVVLSTTRWDGGRLLTDYDLGNGRKMRIAYSLVPGTRQLLEQVTFENGQVIKRIYDAVATNKR